MAKIDLTSLIISLHQKIMPKNYTAIRFGIKTQCLCRKIFKQKVCRFIFCYKNQFLNHFKG